jgi:hypothetical protein
VNLLTAPVVYGLGATLAVALIWGGVQTVRLAGAERDAAKYEAALDKVARDAALARAEFEAGARLTERMHQSDMAALEKSYDERLNEAEREGALVAADLRAGNLRLRQHWQGCAATSAVSAAAGAIGGYDEAAGLREAGSGDLVRVAAECEAQVIGLQDTVRANVRATQPDG